jgi:hypothetical protein
MKFSDCPRTLSSEKVLGLKTEIQGMLVKWKLVGKGEWRRGERLTRRQRLSTNDSESQVFADKHALIFQDMEQNLSRHHFALPVKFMEYI